MVSLVILVMFIYSLAVTFISIYRAMQGKYDPNVVRIPAIDSIDQAIGRAAEMGRPIFFSAGSLGSIKDADVGPMTLAGLDVLSYVIKEASKTATRVVSVCGLADAYAAFVDIHDEAYKSVGRTDLFKESDIRYYSDEFSAYHAGMMETIHDIKPASVLFLGGLSWEVVSVPTAARESYGSLSVGGTARTPMIACCALGCDHFLMSEELFVASAYLSKKPVDKATIASSDLIKIPILAAMIIGTILSLLGFSIVGLLS